LWWVFGQGFFVEPWESDDEFFAEGFGEGGYCRAE
jgi:hypothetical protein